MIKLSIPKNKRRPFPYFGMFIPILIKKGKPFSIKKKFKFTESSFYFFDDADQHDVNKLFGFSVGMHHTNSFRFGWRPNADLSRIEIVGYEYHDKIRIPTIPICEIEPNLWYEYRLNYLPKTQEVQYVVINEIGNNITTKRSPIKLKNINWGYKLDLYFGGNKKTPHKIVFYRK